MRAMLYGEVRRPAAIVVGTWDPLLPDHLELFATAWASHRGGVRRTRLHVRVLARDKAWADDLVAEGAANPVVEEIAAVSGDASARIDRGHAASLGSCRTRQRAARRSQR